MPSITPVPNVVWNRRVRWRGWRDTRHVRGLWLGNDVAGSIVTECDGALHQEDDCCGIEADGEDDFEHGLLALVVAKIRHACAMIVRKLKSLFGPIDRFRAIIK